MCCLVCIEWQKGKMTYREVDRAFAEIVTFSEDGKEMEHALEALEKIKEEAKK